MTLTYEPGQVVKVAHLRGYYQLQFVHPSGRASVVGPCLADGRLTDIARRRVVPAERIRPIK